MEKPDPATLGTFAGLTAGLGGESKAMFGCPCLFVNGNMVAGVYGGGIFFRAAPADHPAWFAAHPDLKPFEPLGRPMKEYLLAAVTSAAPDWLAGALEIARDYGLLLPIKTPKAKKPK